MRNYHRIIACLTALCVLFSSCSKVVRSHKEFMNTLTTKAEVIQKFGYPAQYQEAGETSVWLYDLHKQKRVTRQNPDPVRISNDFSESKKVQEFNYPDKFMEVTFINESVKSANVVGTRYTIRKPQPLKTVLLAVGILGIGVALMALFYVPVDAPFENL